MHRFIRLLLVFCLTTPLFLAAQNDDDLFEANRLKKVFPDDRVAATLVEDEFSFDRARAEDRLPGPARAGWHPVL